MEKKIKILFVDDEALVLQGLQRILRPMRDQWDTVFTESGAKALALMDDAPFDILISDMAMPEMSGADLLNTVQHKHPNTIRIILSGYADPLLISKCFGSAHQFIAKPCDPEALKCIINRAGALRDGRVNESIRHAVAQMQTMPAMPGLYSSMVETLKSPDTGVDEAAMLIARDIGMTANILKLVNSAFFGLPQPIASVAGAVSYLGLETIKNLVLSIEVFAQYQRRRLGMLNVTQLWEHSFQTAAIARNFARRSGFSSGLSDAAFSAGVLHDAGKLILASHAPLIYDRVVSDSRDKRHPAWQVEASVFGADHAEVAGYLFGLWALPAPIVDAIAFHHRPSAAPAANSAVCAAVHVADALANRSRTDRPVILDQEFLRNSDLPDTLPALAGYVGEPSP